MSTRSIIARKINDTQYETVYCHKDERELKKNI